LYSNSIHIVHSVILPTLKMTTQHDWSPSS